MKEKKWVYGSLLQSEIDVNQLNVHCQIHGRFADDFSITVYDVDPRSVGQWTGSHDINNHRIYEGDTLYIAGKGECRVVFSHAAWALENEKHLVFLNECEEQLMVSHKNYRY